MGAGHDHSHGHNHGHHHGHHHAPARGHGRAFAIAVTLNFTFLVVEVIAGLWSGSVALLADAGHNFSDVLSLLLAWCAASLAERPASQGYTFGLKGSSILAAIANAGLLWVALGAILLETLHRLAVPDEPEGKTMMVVAGIGIAINGVSALLFAKGRKNDLNIRAAFLHLMADAAVSAGVVIAGLAIVLTGRAWIDPLTSLLITVAIGWGSWGLLRDAVKMGLHAVPPGIEEPAVRAWLAEQPGVSAVHDLHIWPMSTTENALTAHLVMPGGHPGDAFLHALAHDLEHQFAIHHSTVQIETSAETDCPTDC